MTAAPPTVSVALATYNGGAYLAEQLQSMAAQTVPIDELIVGDDGSTDATLEVLREFAATAPFPVRIEINAHNLGYGENFCRIIGRCSGKYIFLSDQDDRWHPDKVERCLGTFGKTGALAIVHDAALADAQLVPTGHTMMGQAKALNADALDGLFYGCCMAIDRFLVPFLTSRVRNERAASLVEYALLIALIGVVCVVAVTTLGKKASSKFNSVSQAL